MSAEKHTAGPWFTFPHTRHCVGGPAVRPVGEPQTAGIAMCAMAARSPAECEANARLVASSPALLDAAKAAMVCIGELSPTMARVEVMQMLSAAVEQATGGEV